VLFPPALLSEALGAYQQRKETREDKVKLVGESIVNSMMNAVAFSFGWLHLVVVVVEKWGSTWRNCTVEPFKRVP